MEKKRKKKKPKPGESDFQEGVEVVCSLVTLHQLVFSRLLRIFLHHQGSPGGSRRSGRSGRSRHYSGGPCPSDGFLGTLASDVTHVATVQAGSFVKVSLSFLCS
jgi:hypothetical protein